jgi:2,3-bisphosphoglycerate-independent phosphoglycerate mutase
MDSGLLTCHMAYISEGKRMKLLFLFLDGVGLGLNDVRINPLAAVRMPNLENILNGCNLIQNQEIPITTKRATFLALDACLGVDGRPQSASGQTALLTGKNIPALIGQHYGPKPNAEIKAILENQNLFSEFKKSGYRACLLNAYPQEYFDAIKSGRRIPGAVAMATLAAGIPLKTTADLHKGIALSADFTAQGWRKHLNYKDTPILTPEQAGIRLTRLTENYDFTFFEYWLSDYAGHKRNMEAARDLLIIFDQVLGGLLSTWDDNEGLILITSDHGNLEDLGVRNHTRNQIPAIVIGSPQLRENFTKNLKDLTDIFPAILQLFALTS